MLHQQDQTLSKSLLTVRQALKELLGILEFRQRTCLVTLKCQQNLGDYEPSQLDGIESPFS